MPFKRTFALGDIHGHWKHLEKLLEFISYDPFADRLIFLGDYIDRGLNSKITLDLVIELNSENPENVCLMGNHEDLMNSVYLQNNRLSSSIWLKLGGEETLHSFSYDSPEMLKNLDHKYSNFLAYLKPLYVDESLSLVFAHAGVNPQKSLKNQDLYDIDNGPMWVRSRFFMHPEPVQDYRVIFGHTPTFKIEQNLKGVFWKKNLVGIDTGLCYGNKLTALDVTNSNCFVAYCISQTYEKTVEIQPEDTQK